MFFKFGFCIENLYDFKFLENNELQEVFVQDVAQDSHGFMWISTVNGLFRFDGYNVKKYMEGKRPRKIEITDLNDIYVSSSSGIYKYRPEADSLYRLLDCVTRGGIRSFTVKKENEIIISEGDSVFVYDQLKKQVKLLFSSNVICKDILCIGRQYWFATSEGLGLYNEKSGFQLVNNKGNLRRVGFSSKLVYSIENMIFLFDVVDFTEEIISFPYNNMKIMDFHIVKNKILVCSNIGVFAYEMETGKINEIYYSKSGLNQYLLKIYYDKSESIWIGTRKGVMKSFPKDKILYYDLNNYLEDGDGSSNFVENMAIDQHNNIYYLTSEKFLVKKNSKNEFQIFKPFEGIDERITIRSIDIFSDNEILISTKRNLFIYNMKNNSMDILFNAKVFIISILDRDFFLISNMKSVILIDRNGRVFSENKIPNVTSIQKISNSECLLASIPNGLVIYDFKKNKIKKELFKFKKRKFIQDLFYDIEEELVYFETQFGLEILDLKNNSIDIYKKENGLPSNQILGFIKNNGKVYINTTRGIAIFDRKVIVSTLGKEFGFKCFTNTELNKYWKYNYENRRLILIDTNDNIYVGGKNGLNVIIPNKFYQKSQKQQMNLTSIRIFGENSFEKRIAKRDSVFDFSYKHKIISFEFAATNYQDIEKNQYSFFLENYNKNWEYPNNNTISYRSLEPGKYNLKTRYSDFTGTIWDGPQLKINIKPPFWRTYTFYISFTLFSLVAVIGFIKLQTYRIKAQNSALEYRVVRRTHELHKKKEELENINQNLEQLVSSRTKKLHETNEKLVEEFAKKEQLLGQLQESQIQIETNLQQQILLSTLSMDFISLENFYDKLQKNLQSLTQILNLENIYLMEDKHQEEEEGRLIKCLKNSTEIKLMDSISYNEFRDVLSLVYSNSIVVLEDIETVENVNLDKFIKAGIHSLILLPIIVNESVYGFIGSVSKIKDYKWDESIINLFKTITHIIGNAFERKIFQNQLLEKEKTSKALLNASDSYAILFDVDGKIRLTNRNFLKVLEKDLDEVIGNSIYDYFPNVKMSQRQMFFERCLNTKQPVHYEDELGGQFFSNNITPILDTKGNVIRIAHFSHNITKQKKAEKILKQHQEDLRLEVEERTKELRFINQELLHEIKNREKAEEELLISEQLKREDLKKLALQLAHEIKNPLSSINSSAQLVETIQRMKPDVESTIKHMQRITNNVDTCNRVIKELYQFTHDQKLEKNKLSVQSLCLELVEYGKHRDQEKNIKMKCVNDATNSYISVDKFRILQALTNIIANSVDAIEHEGTVCIYCRREDAKVIFEIEDDGNGIEQDRIDRIFEPFYTSKSKGFGLGLAIVKKIIERHNGDIKVESQIGKGTKAIVALPEFDQNVGEINE